MKIKYKVLIMFVSALAFVTYISSLTIDEELSSTQFYSLECRNSCWNGIEPNISDESDVNRILSDLKIDFERIDDFPGGDLTVYEWGVSTSRGEAFASITVENDLVTQVGIPIEECIASIISIYGVPSEIYEKDRYYFLLYDKQKIIFSTNDYHDLSRASVAYIVSSSTYGNFQYADGELEWNKVQGKFLNDCVKN